MTGSTPCSQCPSCRHGSAWWSVTLTTSKSTSFCGAQSSRRERDGVATGAYQTLRWCYIHRHPPGGTGVCMTMTAMHHLQDARGRFAIIPMWIGANQCMAMLIVVRRQDPPCSRRRMCARRVHPFGRSPAPGVANQILDVGAARAGTASSAAGSASACASTSSWRRWMPPGGTGRSGKNVLPLERICCTRWCGTATS